ncbi:MAG: hypothetical protein L6U99_13135 [Clostridium sp.]|nr:MAG: hypothetical protein L6U99_13135 [Clostridium sp.]
MASVTKEAIDKLGYYNPTLIRKKASIKYLFIHDSAPKLKKINMRHLLTIRL